MISIILVQLVRTLAVMMAREKVLRNKCLTHPLAEVDGEHEIAGEGVGEGSVEVEHLEELLAFDDVQVAVGERAHRCGRLAQVAVLPECVAEHVAFAQNRGDLLVLHHFERAAHHKAQRVD